MKSVWTVCVMLGCGLPIGCIPVESEESDTTELDAEETSSVTDALTNINLCAMGLTANALGNLTAVNTSETFVRADAYINTICPALGKDRKLTIVDFWADSIHDYNYKFTVVPTFASVTNAADCADLLVDTRLQRRNTATGAWIEIEHVPKSGVWTFNLNAPNFGTCSPPAYTRTRASLGETNVYRVRTFATNPDGTYATVSIKGANIGHQ